MPRISKLSILQIEELKADVCDPRKSLMMLSRKYHIATASIFYYKKKFVPVAGMIYLLQPSPEPIQKKTRSYESYLREYYKKIGKPYRTPPILGANARWLEWM